MATDIPDRVHLSVAEARALSERATRGIGYEPEDARIPADHVLDAALCGTSAFMGTDLQFRQRLALSPPEGVAIDEHGRPTTDAGAAARPRRDGVDEIRIPGERAYRERARLTREGIEIDGRIGEALIRLTDGARREG